MTPDQTAAFHKAFKIPAFVTSADLQLLETIDPVLKAWATDRRDEVMQAAEQATARLSPEARARSQAVGDLVVEVIKTALVTPKAQIAALEAQLQRLSDELLEVRAQLAAQRDPVEP
jgi:hypothetical protein